MPMKNSATTIFFPLNSKRSIINAVIVPNITLKKREISKIMPVFLNPSIKYYILKIFKGYFI